jgi:hypothetical protein
MSLNPIESYLIPSNPIQPYPQHHVIPSTNQQKLGVNIYPVIKRGLLENPPFIYFDCFPS